MMAQSLGTNPELVEARRRVAAGEATPGLLQALVRLAESDSPDLAQEAEKLLEQAARGYETALSPLYHVVPWSDWIIDDLRFSEVFSRTTELVGDFSTLNAERVARVLAAYPTSLMVFRLVTGYTWAELSDILLTKLSFRLSAQKLQQMERADELKDVPGRLADQALQKLGTAICGIVSGTLMPLPNELGTAGFRSRQHKIDTQDGWSAVQTCVAGGVSYKHLLYERYTGRPFAYVRDALSEKKGDILEDALEALLRQHRIPYDRITDNAIPGFEQAPDFALPDRNTPSIIIEAKLAEDGGTARDKASRIERLRHTCDELHILLIALVDGKGFRRFNDVLFPIIRNTRGHTYTLETLDELLEVDRIRSLRSQ
jgi:hypothetical protein